MGRLRLNQPESPTSRLGGGVGTYGADSDAVQMTWTPGKYLQAHGAQGSDESVPGSKKKAGFGNLLNIIPWVNNFDVGFCGWDWSSFVKIFQTSK